MHSNNIYQRLRCFTWHLLWICELLVIVFLSFITDWQLWAAVADLNNAISDNWKRAIVDLVAVCGATGMFIH